MESPFSDLVDEKFSENIVASENAKKYISSEVFQRKYLHSQKPHKKIVRKWNLPISHPMRKQLWPRLIDLHYGTSISKSIDAESSSNCSNNSSPKQSSLHSSNAQSALTGYELADRRLQPTYGLNSKGRSTLLSLLHELSLSHPELVYSPQTWTFLSLFLHYHSPSVALACLLSLLDRPGFIFQTKNDWRTGCLSLEFLGALGFAGDKAFSLLRKQQKSAPTSDQNRTRIDENKIANPVSENFIDELVDMDLQPRYQLGLWTVMIWYLPFQCLVPIIDCFIVEGPKIFYRVGLVLWHLATSKQKPPASSDCQLASKLRSAAVSYPPDSRSFLKAMFNIRNFSHKHIQGAVTKAAKFQEPRAGLELVDSLVTPCVLPGQRTYTAFGQVKAELTAKGRSSLRPRGSPNHHSSSSLATSDELLFLLNAISDENIAQNFCPTVIFSSQKDGTSINTIFQKCSEHAQISNRSETILLVRTTSGKSLIGAFCTQLWHSTSGSTYFGNGGCFLFRLRPGHPVIYKWKGTDDVGVDRFQLATDTFFEIGGGLGSGPAGLKICNNLIQGESGFSPTFESECLITATEDKKYVGCTNEKQFCTFTISAVELIGFKPVTL